MPYREKLCGVYRIFNRESGKAYVGQSRNVHKRIADHFNLLRRDQHPNPKLQNAFNKYGEQAFGWELEVECADPADLDGFENAFLSGDATFDTPSVYNIASVARAAMLGRKHSEITRAKIAATKTNNPHILTAEQRARLVEGQRRRWLANPEYTAKIRLVVKNPHLSYAERGRMIGSDPSSARKIYLKYKDLLGEL